jgi:hypothetical protein
MKFLALIILLFCLVLPVKAQSDPDWLSVYGLGNSTSTLSNTGSPSGESIQTHGAGWEVQIQWKQGWHPNQAIQWPFFEFRSYAQGVNSTTTSNWESWSVGDRFYPNWNTFKYDKIRIGFVGAVGRLVGTSTVQATTSTTNGVTTTTTASSSNSIYGGQGRVGLRMDRIERSDPASGSWAEFGMMWDPIIGEDNVYLTGHYIVFGRKNIQVFLEPTTNFHMGSGAKQKDQFSLYYGVKFSLGSLLQ